MPGQTVVITGANSYLGSNIVEYLVEHTGYNIIALVSPRWQASVADQLLDRLQYVSADLTRPLSSEVRDLIVNADRVFHFAWTRGFDVTTIDMANIDMIRHIMEAMGDPSNFIFISTVAGTPKALSTYGITKHNSTKLVLSLGGSVLVCGLVVEANPIKGPYRMLKKFVGKFPLSIRLSQGELSVFPIHIDDLYKSIKFICENKLSPKIYKMFGEPIDFNKFMASIENLYPKRRITIPLKASFILDIAAFLKKTKLMPVKICDQILTFFLKDSDYLMSQYEIGGEKIRNCNDSTFLM